jgi:hypothetical protein
MKIERGFGLVRLWRVCPPPDDVSALRRMHPPMEDMFAYGEWTAVIANAEKQKLCNLRRNFMS